MPKKKEIVHYRLLNDYNTWNTFKPDGLGGIGAISRRCQSESTTSEHSHAYNGVRVPVFRPGNGKKLCGIAMRSHCNGAPCGSCNDTKVVVSGVNPAW